MKFSNEMCFLCLETHDELIEIYGKQGIELNVGSILEEHFWFEVGTFAAKKICRNCWKNVESFHIFYNSVKAIHQQQTEPRIEQSCETKATIGHGLVYSIKEEPIDIKEVFSDVTDMLDTIDCPSPRCDDSDVDSSTAGTATDPPTVQHKKRKYNRKVLGSTEPTCAYKCKKDIHTPLLSQYFNMACELCETKLLSYQDTKNHYRKVHDINDGYLICCNVKYVQLKQMLAHCEWHTKQTDSLLSQVSASAHAEPTVYKYQKDFYTPLISQYFNMACDLCESELTSYRDTMKHFREVHNNKAGYLICCNRKYKSLPLMLSHCEWHVNPDAFKCSQCSKTFRDKNLLGRHLSLAHLPETDKIFNCNDCGKKFSKLHLVKAHQQSCHDPSFKCTICQKRFTGKLRLRHHIRDVHSLEDEREFHSNLKFITKEVNEEAKKFECDICGSRYKFLALLRGHIKRVHLNADRNVDYHICEICAKRFKTSAEYKRHYDNVHTTIPETVSEKVQCDICGNWLKNKACLYKHFKNHNSEPATCKICGRVCRNLITLHRHMQTVHRKPALECKICGRMFKAQQVFKEHMAIHYGVTDLYTCAICKRTFRSKANMYSHRKRYHPDEVKKLKKQIFNAIDATRIISVI